MVRRPGQRLCGTEIGRRQGVLPGGQEGPGGRAAASERGGGAGRQQRASQPPRCLTGQRTLVVGGPRHHGERHPARDAHPALPVRQLHQIIGTHDPNEADAGKPGPQRPQGRVRVAGAQRRLDRSRHDPAAVGQARRAGQPVGQRCHAIQRFERVARGDEQPDLVQPQPVQRQAGNMCVPSMGRVEGPAEQPHPGTPAVTPSWNRAGNGQGRTWPVPVTT